MTTEELIKVLGIAAEAEEKITTKMLLLFAMIKLAELEIALHP